ncbi:MAG: arginase family protein [Rhodobacteraceae bacterium]|nr:arginase family protein [Paracoccaceae bacterium]
MTKEITLIGAPSSIAAHAPGQEKTPVLLRKAGLLDEMKAAGLKVKDTGDLPGFRYHADPSPPRARNVSKVVENAKNVMEAVATAVENGDIYLVLGGGCTNGVGAVNGATRNQNLRTGVIYLDMHGDMNTPETVDSGALDWMGVAHMLGMKGAVPEFANLDGRSPVLQNDQIVFLGWDFEGANSDAEREAMIRRRMKVVFLDELQKDPLAAAKRAVELLGPVDQIVVHFDVDVIDFAECPLAENYRHGEGCTLAQATDALSVIAALPAFTGLTVAQLNPDHGEEDLATLKRFAKALAGSLAYQ